MESGIKLLEFYSSDGKVRAVEAVPPLTFGPLTT